jgi:hypothetical protein
LDVIFPAQKILFKTVDFVRLGLTAVLGTLVVVKFSGNCSRRSLFNIGLYFALHTFSELFSEDGVDSTALAACIGSTLFFSLFFSNHTQTLTISRCVYDRLFGVCFTYVLGDSMERRHVSNGIERNAVQKVGRQSSRCHSLSHGSVGGRLLLLLLLLFVNGDSDVGM